MKETIGPDGFPFSASDKLSESHKLLEERLTDGLSVDVDARIDLSKWKKVPPKARVPELIEATLRRLIWLRQHDAELQMGHVARIKLVQLLRVLYTRKFQCTESQLRTMLDLTVPLLNEIEPDGPVDYVMEYIRENDLNPELCKSLHNFQSNLIQVGSVSSMQSLRQRLHTLLFMDEWEPLNPSKCWSESVRRDFRMMTGERRTKWRKLLRHIRGNAPQIVPPSWKKEAELRLAEVGVEDFTQQLEIWFAPFRSGEPLPLSVAGSHILKGLIWYASLTNDERAKSASLWLLDARWKQKRNFEKSVVALSLFGISKEELLSRKLLKPISTPSPNFIEKILQLLKEVINSPNTSTHLGVDFSNDEIIVQGQLHFYCLYRKTGRIVRATDKAELELNWSAIPDAMRLTLHSECDSDDQVHLRATMLMFDSFNGQYFSLKT
jgi:hypothetical protein